MFVEKYLIALRLYQQCIQAASNENGFNVTKLVLAKLLKLRLELEWQMRQEVKRLSGIPRINCTKFRVLGDSHSL
jgi:hypothetical protein